jgi:hypothetical protein
MGELWEIVLNGQLSPTDRTKYQPIKCQNGEEVGATWEATMQKTTDIKRVWLDHQEVWQLEDVLIAVAEEEQRMETDQLERSLPTSQEAVKDGKGEHPNSEIEKQKGLDSAHTTSTDIAKESEQREMNTQEEQPKKTNEKAAQEMATRQRHTSTKE